VTVVGNQILAGHQIVTTDASGSNRTQYGCNECNMCFNSQEALALHLRLHSGDKNLMTDLCALTATIPTHLIRNNTYIEVEGGKCSKYPFNYSSKLPLNRLRNTLENCLKID
jgi:hypothetical protein